VTVIGYETDRVSAQNFSLRYIESRLATILPRAIGVNDKKRDFLFFSVGDEGIAKPGSQSLIFTFDNQVNMDKDFSGHVLARLYLDKDGNLMIAYWPSPKRWENNENPPMKKEMLLQNVDNLSFEFYIAPERKSAEEKPRENEPQTKNKDTEKDQKKETGENNDSNNSKGERPEPRGDWRREAWLQDYKQLPVMVKMIVTMPKEPEPHVFIFPLANTKSHVVYE
jgi:hypothetical protein